MIAMLSNQMFYRTVEEIGNDCHAIRCSTELLGRLIAMLNNQMF